VEEIEDWELLACRNISWEDDAIGNVTIEGGAVEGDVS